MNRLRRLRAFRGALWLVLALFAAGCAVGAGVQLKPQSHFSYPNSNVIPLGRVQGEASVTTIFVPTILDADLEEEAVQKALKEKGGDILINYKLLMKIVYIPFFLPIFVTTYTVDGTAGKMEVGKQQLR